MNTCNLTQISLQNDPINRRMHGFSFRVSEDEVWSSRCEFFFLFRSKFDFKGSVGAEMHQDYKETNNTWNDEVNKSNWMKIHGPVLPWQGTFFLKNDFWAQPSDKETHRDQRSRWDVISWIGVYFWWLLDRGRRFEMNPHRVKKKMLSFDHPLDLNPTITMCLRVHRSRAMLAVITRAIDGSDEFTKVNFNPCARFGDRWTSRLPHLRALFTLISIRRSTLLHAACDQITQRRIIPHRRNSGEKSDIYCELKTMVNKLSSDNQKTYIDYKILYMINITMRLRVTSAPCRRSRVSTWPWAPRRIHVGSREYYPLFAIYLNILND